MEGMIKINDHNGQSVVSARELHSFLGSKREFATWIKQRIQKYGFVENEDYTTFDEFVKRGDSNLKSKSIEYSLTLETAKELAMVEANDKGRQARRYFIDQEKKLRDIQQATPSIIETVVNKVLDRLEAEGRVLQLAPPSPPVKYFSVSEYIREYRCITRFFSKWEILSISTTAKRMCKQEDLDIIVRPSEKWEKGVNTYPEYVLEIALDDFLRPF